MTERDSRAPTSSNVSDRELRKNAAVKGVPGLSMKETVGRTRVTFAENFGCVFLLALIATAPDCGYLLFPLDPVSATLLAMTLQCLKPILAYVITASVAFGVFRWRRGEAAGPGRCLVAGICKIPNLFVQLLLIGLVSLTLLAAWFALFAKLLQSFLVFPYDASYRLSRMALSFGLSAIWCVIVGWYVSCLSVSVPACVAEGVGPLESLKRSRVLTKSNRLKIFCLLLIPLSLICLVFLGAMSNLVARFSVNDFPLRVVVTALYLTLNALLVGFAQTLVATLYLDLRVIEDGLSLVKTVDVFD
jgi:hypothetical protein